MNCMTLKILLKNLYSIQFETNLFKGNSLAMPIIGTESNVANFNRDDLTKLY